MKVTKVAIQKITIGYTRDQGYLLFDTRTKEFGEYSIGEVTKMLKSSDTKVCGLKLKNGKIDLDLDGFNQENMAVKSSMSMGRFRLMKPNSQIKDGRLYAVVRAIDTGEKELIYEIISNTCARTFITEEGVRQLYKDGVLSGVWVDSKTGQITLADAIEIVDANTSENGGEHHKEEDTSTGQDIDTGVLGDSVPVAGNSSDIINHGDGEDIHNETSVKDETLEQVEEKESLITDKTSDEEIDPFAIFDETTPTCKPVFGDVKGLFEDEGTSVNEVDGCLDQEDEAYETNDDMSQIGKKAYVQPEKTDEKIDESKNAKKSSQSKKSNKSNSSNKGEAKKVSNTNKKAVKPAAKVAKAKK